MAKLHPYLYSRTVGDGHIHRRVTPELRAGAMAWLGEPMTDRQAARYEAHREAVIAANEAEDRSTEGR